MKYCLENKNSAYKCIVVVLLLLLMEVHSLEDKINLEVKKLNKNLLKRNQAKDLNIDEHKLGDNEKDILFYRFKSHLGLNTKDGEENTAIVTNSFITSDKKLNPKPEDKEIEVIPHSAEAGSEFSWGFLLWSFMNFGAENAISGHSGYWLSKRDVVHDYWQAAFNCPQIIDTLQISWRLPPKRFKIFYKLDDSSDWIGATEVFIKEEVKDKNGNLIPDNVGEIFNTVYFKKPLLCTRLKIMMNQPVRKKSFSISKVNFYNKISRGIIKAPLINNSKNFCWFINTTVIRKGVPVYAYPCLEAMNIGLGTELFQINTNKQIKPIQSELCVGYDKKTKTVILNECQEEGSASVINYNLDYSIYFIGMQNTAIGVDITPKFPNFINEDTEVLVTSEEDKNDNKKENMKNEGGNYWSSEPGQTDVTVQLLFGKIVCKDCQEDGAYESKKIDTIQIYWVREPRKFSVYIWNPGFSWKNIISYDNNTEKVTTISLVGEMAAGIMIRMTEGNKYENIGGMVSYAIMTVYVSFNGYILNIGSKNKRPLANKFFDFENQGYLVKKPGFENFLEGKKALSKAHEKLINIYKNLKSSTGALRQSKNLSLDICKKINSLNDLIGHKSSEKLRKFARSKMRKIDNQKFLNYLAKFGRENILDYLTGYSTDPDEEYEYKNFSSSNDLEKNNDFEGNLLNLNSEKSYLKNVRKLITNSNTEAEAKAKLQGTSESSSLDNLNFEYLSSNPVRTFSTGTSSKKHNDSSSSHENYKGLGSYDYPAIDCLQIKKLNSHVLSGFYYIYPECSPRPIRVFCDFVIYKDAVDIYIFKDGLKTDTPNLSYLNIKNAYDIRHQCAKYGLNPIEIQNKDMVTRIHQILFATGMNLKYPNFIPLGYDYTCKNNKCSQIYNSISSERSTPIMTFFKDNENSDKQVKQKAFHFVGLGTPESPRMIKYDPNLMSISGLVCSTNVFENSSLTNTVRSVDCEFNLSENLHFFGSSSEVAILCPKNCQRLEKEIYGSGTYHGDSSTCRAAVHSGDLNTTGGKVIVRIQEPLREYIGSLQNGIKSANKHGDGIKAFILLKYTPKCPQFKHSGKGRFSSFIENELKIELRDNQTNGNRTITNDQSLNNLNVKILLDSILSGVKLDKNSELGQKVLLLKQLLPKDQKIADKLNQEDKKKENEKVTENKNHQNNSQVPIVKNHENKVDQSVDSNKAKENNNNNDNKNVELLNQIRFLQKSLEKIALMSKNESAIKNAVSDKLNLKAANRKANDKFPLGLGAGIGSNAINSASNIISELAANTAANLSASPLNYLGYPGNNYIKDLFGGLSINPVNASPASGAPNNPNDILSAQNQAYAARPDLTDSGNPLVNGGSPDDVAGRFTTPNQILANSISNSINNNFANNPYTLNNQVNNISKAFAGPQKYQDPNLADNATYSSSLTNSNNPSSIVNGINPTPQVVDSELPGEKRNLSSNPNGALDLSQTDSGEQGFLVDPNDMREDKDENKTNSSDDSQDSNCSGDNNNKNSLSSSDVPNNGFKSKETTDKGMRTLDRLFNSSIVKDIQKIKEKQNKIKKVISQFLSDLSQTVNGNGNSSVFLKDSSATNDHRGGNSEADINENDMISNGFSMKEKEFPNLDFNLNIGNDSSNGIDLADIVDGKSECNISNSPILFEHLHENENKIKNYLENLMKLARSRIYRTQQLKDNWTEKYDRLTAQEPVKINYSQYENDNVASKKIFEDIFTVMRLGKEEIYKSNWGLYSNNIKDRKRALGIVFNQLNKVGFASSMILLRGKLYYDVQIKLDVMMANTGLFGVIFRAKDRYNFYTFIVDKNSGSKVIAKMINGELIIIKKISDGGIVLNQWHSINIEVRANIIRIIMFDSDNPKKLLTDKSISIEDDTFVRGTVGIFTNGIKGFYFDNFETIPLSCFSPWIPKRNVSVRNSNANNYFEDFRGELKEKYNIHDIDSSVSRNGPAEWLLNNETSDLGYAIEQKTDVFDFSPHKRPTFITLKNVNLTNGNLFVQFTPKKNNGIISIIFKYGLIFAKNQPGEGIEQFYTFEMNNENPENALFQLRLHNNNEIKIISSVNANQFKGLKYAYLPMKMNTVFLQVINGQTTVKISQDNQHFHIIFNLNENSIPNGTIGIGTFKTPVLFSQLSLNPLKIHLTSDDVNQILGNKFPGIPMPSPLKVHEAFLPLNHSNLKTNKIETAEKYLNLQISFLSSALGYNYKKAVPKYDSSITDEMRSPSNRKEESSKGNYNWKQCVFNQEISQRKSFCSNNFSSTILQEKCETDFCNTCCNMNISAKNSNVLHMCKKTCYKSSLSSNRTDEYKNICINSSDTQTSIYDFCQKKMEFYDKKLLHFCKLDMCNLCCVGMDSMKKKNFSISNLQQCFGECSREYNIQDVSIGNSKKCNEADPGSYDLHKQNYSNLGIEDENDIGELISLPTNMPKKAIELIFDEMKNKKSDSLLPKEPIPLPFSREQMLKNNDNVDSSQNKVQENIYQTTESPDTNNNSEVHGANTNNNIEVNQKFNNQETEKEANIDTPRINNTFSPNVGDNDPNKYEQKTSPTVNDTLIDRRVINSNTLQINNDVIQQEIQNLINMNNQIRQSEKKVILKPEPEKKLNSSE